MKVSPRGELYAGMLSSLEKETNDLLEAFLNKLENAQHPSAVEERIAHLEGKCEALMLPSRHDEFALNEILVVADRLEDELKEASGLLPDAYVHEKQEEWAEGFEGLKGNLLFLREQVKNSYSRGMAQSSQKAFREKVASCRKIIKRLHRMLYGKNAGRMHKRLAKIKQRVRGIKDGVADASKNAAKQRLAAQIGERKEHLYSLLAKSGHGKLIIDSKHFTVKSSNGFVHDAIGIDELTHHALEGMLANTPLCARLKKLGGSNSSIAASFETIPTPEGIKIKVVAGERVITGDAIVYKPHTFYLSANA